MKDKGTKKPHDSEFISKKNHVCLTHSVTACTTLRAEQNGANSSNSVCDASDSGNTSQASSNQGKDTQKAAYALLPEHRLTLVS